MSSIYIVPVTRPRSVISRWLTTALIASVIDFCVELDALSPNGAPVDNATILTSSFKNEVDNMGMLLAAIGMRVKQATMSAKHI